jgi:hypothetical protein
VGEKFLDFAPEDRADRAVPRDLLTVVLALAGVALLCCAALDWIAYGSFVFSLHFR